jgi:hypothetical protein
VKPLPETARDDLLARRLNLIGVAILIAGLVAAAVIYLSAVDPVGDAYAYDIGSGGVYVIAPTDSKAYRHDVALYGGKAALLADQFNRWFEGLWQGRRLAVTLACLSVAGALVCFLAARQLQRTSDLGSRNL